MRITLVSNVNQKRPCMDHYLLTAEELRAGRLPSEGHVANAAIGAGLERFDLRDSEVLYYLTAERCDKAIHRTDREVVVHGCPHPMVYGFIVGWQDGQHVDTLLDARHVAATVRPVEAAPCAAA